jgi:hypothetical protein
MIGGEIRDDLKAFILKYVESVVDVELLILLTERREACWTPEEVARELRVEPAWAVSELARFASLGLVSETSATPPVYRYGFRTADLETSVRDLIAMYRERRVSVIDLIYSRPSEAIRSFADAFRLRKD